MPLICSKRDAGISLKSIMNIFKRRITCSTNKHTFAIELVLLSWGGVICVGPLLPGGIQNKYSLQCINRSNWNFYLPLLLWIVKYDKENHSLWFYFLVTESSIVCFRNKSNSRIWCHTNQKFYSVVMFIFWPCGTLHF